MKTQNRIGASLLAMAAVCTFTGCATQPVGEITEVRSMTGACGNQMVRIDSRHREEAGYDLLRMYRPYGIEPVGERIVGPRFLSFGNITNGPTRQPISPYGPTSPCVNSLWW